MKFSEFLYKFNKIVFYLSYKNFRVRLPLHHLKKGKPQSQNINLSDQVSI